MKHIKRRFSVHVKIPGFNQTLEKLSQSNPEIIDPIDMSVPEGMKGVLVMENEELCEAFGFVDTVSKKEYLTPEPDPTLIYFNVAQINYRLIVTNHGREHLIQLLAKLMKSDSTRLMHTLYDFFSASAAFSTFLFMAMESAVNRVIPEKYELKKKGTRNTIVYDNSQVQQLEFKEKVKEILPEITGKKFWNDHPNEWNFLISDLKKLRDEIVHTKRVFGNQTHYREIYVRVLNFDFQHAILYAKLFINYYHKGLVEECDCGADF